MHDAAGPRLAAQMRKERPHHPIEIDPVCLGAPGAPVHLDAGRVDLIANDTLCGEPLGRGRGNGVLGEVDRTNS